MVLWLLHVNTQFLPLVKMQSFVWRGCASLIADALPDAPAPHASQVLRHPVATSYCCHQCAIYSLFNSCLRPCTVRKAAILLIKRSHCGSYRENAR